MIRKTNTISRRNFLSLAARTSIGIGVIGITGCAHIQRAELPSTDNDILGWETYYKSIDKSNFNEKESFYLQKLRSRPVFPTINSNPHDTSFDYKSSVRTDIDFLRSNSQYRFEFLNPNDDERNAIFMFNFTYKQR